MYHCLNKCLKACISLDLAKKELTGIDELGASVRRVTEQMRTEHVANERYNKALVNSMALSRDELVRQNAASRIRIEDLEEKGMVHYVVGSSRNIRTLLGNMSGSIRQR